MPTFPISFPTSVGIKSSTFGLRRIVGVSASNFTAQAQKYRYDGEYWQGSVTFRPTTYAQSAELKAFITSLQGQYGTFLYGDPDNLALGNRGAGGTILVNGAAQTGNTLNVDGATPSTLVLRAGDYFQLGSAASSRLHMVTSNFTTNGSGAGTIEFEPRLRSAPSDNAALVLTTPRTVMRLTENLAEWSSNQSAITEITVNFIEDL